MFIYFMPQIYAWQSNFMYSDIILFIRLFIYSSLFIIISVVFYIFFISINIITPRWRNYSEVNFKSFTLFITSLFSIYFFIFSGFLYSFLFSNFSINSDFSTGSSLYVFFDSIVVDFSSSYGFTSIFNVTFSKFSLIFFLLFCFLYPIIISLMGVDYSPTNFRFYIYMVCVFFLSYYLLMVENILLFYFIYEIILILVFGAMYNTSNSRGSVEAAIFYIGWAILGSILVGLGVILVIALSGSVTFTDLKNNSLSSSEVYYIYILFFFGFGTKLSTWPFWYWLPKAHVEVSTGMSVFLSCILIKLSYFCLFRFQFALSSEISFNVCIVVTFLSAIDTIFRFINLKDLKAIIAYSSVLHTNLLLALVHLDTFKIINGTVLYVWGHSLATASIFIAVNLIESRYSSRNIIQVSGLWYTTPLLGYLTLWSILFFLDLPITLFFWGELWLWIVTCNALPFVALQVLFLCNVIFISIFFKIWWGVLFGSPDSTVQKINSVEFRELITLLLWVIFVQFLLGIQPSILTTYAGYIF